MALHDPPLEIPFVRFKTKIDGKEVEIEGHVTEPWAQWLIINKRDKSDKVEGGTSGNLVTLADDGNYQDASKVLPSGDLVGTSDSQTISGKTFSELTASRIVASDGNKKLQSINISDWIEAAASAGLTITDDGDGTMSITVKVKADSGLTIDASGLQTVLKTGFGVIVDADGLQLKQQANIADASESHTITDPADSPATADALRDDLVTNAIPEIEGALDALGAKINAILALVLAAEFMAAP